MAVVTMRELLDSGVHFGHQTRRWNPKMKRFIFTERNGIYIIDIQQSLALIDKAYDFVKDTVAKGGNVLFVGTKKQAQEPIQNQANRVGMPFVTERCSAECLLTSQPFISASSASKNWKLSKLQTIRFSLRKNCSCSAVNARSFIRTLTVSAT